jgi:DNA-binding NarL/FixJ family response regulator
MDILTLGIITRQKLIRQGFFLLLQTLALGELRWVIEADSLREACEQIAASKPDLLLIDCDYCADCPEGIQKVCILSPSTKCVLLARTPDEAFALRAARNGAWGLVAMEMDSPDLKLAIEKVVAGEMWFENPTLSKAIQASLVQ